MSLDRNTGAKRAREARGDLGYTREGPLPDVVEAVEERGGAHVVVLDLPEGVAGAYVARADCPLLFVNGHQALSRQRFTLAHEFGHHRMGHASVVDEQRAINGQLHDPNEVRANAFAAEFLLPRDAVRAWGREHVDGPLSLEQVVLLACEYGVSAQVARYGLQNARVLNDPPRCKQLDERSPVRCTSRWGSTWDCSTRRTSSPMRSADCRGSRQRCAAARSATCSWGRSTPTALRCGSDGSPRRSRRCWTNWGSLSCCRRRRSDGPRALLPHAATLRATSKSSSGIRFSNFHVKDTGRLPS